MGLGSGYETDDLCLARGPVILVGASGGPIHNRETWLEVLEPGPVPDGFIGIVLRGQEVGGPSGVGPGLQLIQQVPQGSRVILDSGIRPADMPAALMASGADGVVLSDVLMGLSEYELPENLRSRLAKATGEKFACCQWVSFPSECIGTRTSSLAGGSWVFGSNQVGLVDGRCAS